MSTDKFESCVRLFMDQGFSEEESRQKARVEIAKPVSWQAVAAKGLDNMKSREMDERRAYSAKTDEYEKVFVVVVLMIPVACSIIIVGVGGIGIMMKVLKYFLT